MDAFCQPLGKGKHTCILAKGICLQVLRWQLEVLSGLHMATVSCLGPVCEVPEGRAAL